MGPGLRETVQYEDEVDLDHAQRDAEDMGGSDCKDENQNRLLQDVIANLAADEASSSSSSAQDLPCIENRPLTKTGEELLEMGRVAVGIGDGGKSESTAGNATSVSKSD